VEVWQLARDLYKLVFKITSEEPFCRDYKFRNQMKDSSGTVADNIAEGLNTKRKTRNA
jgi:four helix bundle protein